LEYPEVLQNAPLFVHRDNEDGTIASFCRKCFMTIASSQRNVDIERAEGYHKCNPIQLEYVDSILNQALRSEKKAHGARLVTESYSQNQ
jgi:hypothetical protein